MKSFKKGIKSFYGPCLITNSPDDRWKKSLTSLTRDHLVFLHLTFVSSYDNIAKFWPCKVHIFWEGHKILQNLHSRFDWQYIGQIYGGDFAKFCGLLRIYELYPKAYFRLEFLTANFGFVKTMRKIFLNFVCFSESPNFN